MKKQAAAVAAELSGKGPAEGVTKAAPLLQDDGEAFAPADNTAVHPKLRQKAAGMSRYATWSSKASLWAAMGTNLMLASTCLLILLLSFSLQPLPDKRCARCLDLRQMSRCRASAMTSSWQNTDSSFGARLASLPELATAAATLEGRPERAASGPERAHSGPERAYSGQALVKRSGSNTQSDPIEPQPTPFEAFTQAPLSTTEKPDRKLAGPAVARLKAADISSSLESSAMRMSLMSASQLSASQAPAEGQRSLSARSGPTGSMQVIALLRPCCLHFAVHG